MKYYVTDRRDHYESFIRMNNRNRYEWTMIHTENPLSLHGRVMPRADVIVDESARMTWEFAMSLHNRMV